MEALENDSIKAKCPKWYSPASYGTVVPHMVQSSIQVIENPAKTLAAGTRP